MISQASKRKTINIVLSGVNFGGQMAGSMRIKNLLSPLLNQRLIRLHNLIIVGGNDFELKYADQQRDMGFYVNSYKISNPLSLIRYFILGIRYVREMKGETCKNIFYIYGYPSPENILFVLIARLYGYRIVFDIIEDNRYIDSYSSWRARIKTQISLFLFNRLRRQAHGCIAISHYLCDLCRKLTNGSIPVELIPGSVDLEELNRLPLPTGDAQQFNFFYGGSFSEKDGIDIMIRAFELVASMNPQTKLVLTGKAADRHMKTLLHQIETSPAKPQIEYLGFLSRDQYLGQLARGDVLLMLRVDSPFANAGFPYKLTEYLASGRPIIASRVGDVDKYLTHKENAILVDPSDIEQISAAMLYCLAHKSEIKDIGKKGRSTAEKWFDANKHSIKLSDFFERL